MLYLKNSLLSAALLTVALLAPTVHAEDPKPAQTSESSDMAIRQEITKYAILGQQQLVYLIKESTKEYSGTLTDSKPNMPAAWMLMDDGKTIKRIDIDDQAGGAPAQLRILMYRAALKSVARRGKIVAAAILYTGKVSKDSDEQALVIEHEHRLGISGNKIIPYEIKGDKILYGEPVTSEKPFQLFYDSKEESQSGRKQDEKQS
jgi:hypothetical protein